MQTGKQSKPKQQGIVLFTVLIALVALSLASIALVRSIDTGTVIAGNLAFRQAATQAADAGTEAALEAINSRIAAGGATSLHKTAAPGYYASRRSGCDLTGSVTSTATDDVLWGGGTSAGTNTDCNMVAVSVGASSLPAGYAASYVINRLCDADGAPGVAVPGGTNMCDAYAPTTVAADDGASMTGSAPYKAAPEPGAVKYFYRVTTRVTGPSNTVSFVQVTLVN